MNQEAPKKSIHENILKAIESGKIKMRPHWHFVLKAVLWLFGTALVFVIVVYTISFMIFISHQNGTWFIRDFGAPGIQAFLVSLPWTLIIISIIFILLLELLIHRYKFGYKKPLMYSILGLLLLVAISGAFLAKTPLHSGLLRQAQNNNLPFAGGFYKGYGMMSHENILIGTVLELTEEGYKLEDSASRIARVLITPRTRFGPNTKVEEDDQVVIFGQPQGDAFEAFGVRETSEIVLPPLRSRKHMR